MENIKPVSEEINEIVPKRWSEIVKVATGAFHSRRTYKIAYKKDKLSVDVTAPSEAEVKDLLLFVLKVKKED